MMLSNVMKGKTGVPPAISVDKVALDRGAEVEAGEHKWATSDQARRIARDHIAECGAGYYEALEKMEKELEEGDKEEEKEEEKNDD